MHRGFRHPADNTCSCCDNEIEEPGPDRVLCNECRKRADEAIGPRVSKHDTVITASIGSSTWHEGGMYRGAK